MLDAYQMGQREPFLSGLVPTVAEMMKRPLSRGRRQRDPRIQTVVMREEEEQFLKNLENGQKLISATSSRRRSPRARKSSKGKDAFTLHSTYGIPFEVTESLAADQNLRIDRAGFDKEMVEFGRISRGSTDAAAAVFSDRAARHA